MIQLSRRLQAVAQLAAVPELRCVADVGTDHGYLPIRLVEQGFAKRAIAMDVRQGPLQRAREHIEEHQLSAYIETRLSDGLAALQRDEVQVIVIAGMGGATMKEILQAGQSVIGADTVLVLQPQSELYEFRRYLMEHGFVLLSEDMVAEDGKFYPMMKVKKSRDGQDTMSVYSGLELRYGPLLLRQRHPVLHEFLQWQLRQKERILTQLTQEEGALGHSGQDESVSGHPKQDERTVRRACRERELQEEIAGICQALSIFSQEGSLR